jgi:diguanylate cyclase (GGDEF)-like protein
MARGLAPIANEHQVYAMPAVTDPLRARTVHGAENNAEKACAPADAAAELAALRTIVDDLDYGIVVLDAERRVQFVNRAFRSFWHVPDDIAESRPTFIKLMYHGRGTAAYAVPPHRLGDYLAKQMQSIRTGCDGALNIRLSNGEVIRFRCKALPDGGRLLTYGNVSDLVREAEALERLATIDGMTGINNRRNFLSLAETEWARFRRYGRPLALLMFDIDHFKSVNDTYGHDVGDEVIKAIADVLQKHKRTSDIVGRLGGEEFALVLPEATLDSAVAAGERLRKLVADTVIASGGTRIPVTISVGASLCGAAMAGIDELIKTADLALYEAKRSGRNRVCRYAPADGDGAPPASEAASAASKALESTLR